MDFDLDTYGEEEEEDYEEEMAEESEREPASDQDQETEQQQEEDGDEQQEEEEAEEPAQELEREPKYDPDPGPESDPEPEPDAEPEPAPEPEPDAEPEPAPGPAPAMPVEPERPTTPQATTAAEPALHLPPVRPRSAATASGQDPQQQLLASPRSARGARSDSPGGAELQKQRSAPAPARPRVPDDYPAAAASDELRTAFTAYARTTDWRGGVPPPPAGRGADGRGGDGAPDLVMNLAQWMRLCSDIGLPEQQGGPISGTALQTVFSAYRPHGSNRLTYLAFVRCCIALCTHLRFNVLPAISAHGAAMEKLQQQQWQQQLQAARNATTLRRNRLSTAGIVALDASTSTSGAPASGESPPRREPSLLALPTLEVDAAEGQQEAAMLREAQAVLDDFEKQGREPLSAWRPRPPPEVGEPEATLDLSTMRLPATSGGYVLPDTLSSRASLRMGSSSPPRQHGNWVRPESTTTPPGGSNPYAGGRSKLFAPQLRPIRGAGGDGGDEWAGGRDGPGSPDVVSQPIGGGLYGASGRSPQRADRLGAGAGRNRARNMLNGGDQSGGEQGGALKLPALRASTNAAVDGAAGQQPATSSRLRSESQPNAPQPKAPQAPKPSGPSSRALRAVGSPARDPRPNSSPTRIAMNSGGAGAGGLDDATQLLMQKLLTRVQRLEKKVSGQEEKVSAVTSRMTAIDGGAPDGAEPGEQAATKLQAALDAAAEARAAADASRAEASKALKAMASKQKELERQLAEQGQQLQEALAAATAAAPPAKAPPAKGQRQAEEPGGSRGVSASGGEQGPAASGVGAQELQRLDEELQALRTDLETQLVVLAEQLAEQRQLQEDTAAAAAAGDAGARSSRSGRVGSARKANMSEPASGKGAEEAGDSAPAAAAAEAASLASLAEQVAALRLQVAALEEGQEGLKAAIEELPQQAGGGVQQREALAAAEAAEEGAAAADAAGPGDIEASEGADGGEDGGEAGSAAGAGDEEGAEGAAAGEEGGEEGEEGAADGEDGGESGERASAGRKPAIAQRAEAVKAQLREQLAVLQAQPGAIPEPAASAAAAAADGGAEAAVAAIAELREQVAELRSQVEAVAERTAAVAAPAAIGGADAEADDAGGSAAAIAELREQVAALQAQVEARPASAARSERGAAASSSAVAGTAAVGELQQQLHALAARMEATAAAREQRGSEPEGEGNGNSSGSTAELYELLRQLQQQVNAMGEEVAALQAAATATGKAADSGSEGVADAGGDEGASPEGQEEEEEGQRRAVVAAAAGPAGEEGLEALRQRLAELEAHVAATHEAAAEGLHATTAKQAALEEGLQQAMDSLSNMTRQADTQDAVLHHLSTAVESLEAMAASMQPGGSRGQSATGDSEGEPEVDPVTAAASMAAAAAAKAAAEIAAEAAVASVAKEVARGTAAATAAADSAAAAELALSAADQRLRELEEQVQHMHEQLAEGEASRHATESALNAMGAEMVAIGARSAAAVATAERAVNAAAASAPGTPRGPSPPSQQQSLLAPRNSQGGVAGGQDPSTPQSPTRAASRLQQLQATNTSRADAMTPRTAEFAATTLDATAVTTSLAILQQHIVHLHQRLSAAEASVAAVSGSSAGNIQKLKEQVRIAAAAALAAKETSDATKKWSMQQLQMVQGELNGAKEAAAKATAAAKAYQPALPQRSANSVVEDAKISLIRAICGPMGDRMDALEAATAGGINAAQRACMEVVEQVTQKLEALEARGMWPPPAHMAASGARQPPDGGSRPPSAFGGLPQLPPPTGPGVTEVADGIEGLAATEAPAAVPPPPPDMSDVASEVVLAAVGPLREQLAALMNSVDALQRRVSASEQSHASSVQAVGLALAKAEQAAEAVEAIQQVSSAGGGGTDGVAATAAAEFAFQAMVSPLAARVESLEAAAADGARGSEERGAAAAPGSAADVALREQLASAQAALEELQERVAAAEASAAAAADKAEAAADKAEAAAAPDEAIMANVQGRLERVTNELRQSMDQMSAAISNDMDQVRTDLIVLISKQVSQEVARGPPKSRATSNSGIVEQPAADGGPTLSTGELSSAVRSLQEKVGSAIKELTDYCVAVDMTSESVELLTKHMAEVEERTAALEKQTGDTRKAVQEVRKSFKEGAGGAGAGAGADPQLVEAVTELERRLAVLADDVRRQLAGAAGAAFGAATAAGGGGGAAPQAAAPAPAGGPGQEQLKEQVDRLEVLVHEQEHGMDFLAEVSENALRASRACQDRVNALEASINAQLLEVKRAQGGAGAATPPRSSMRTGVSGLGEGARESEMGVAPPGTAATLGGKSRVGFGVATDLEDTKKDIQGLERRADQFEKSSEVQRAALMQLSQRLDDVTRSLHTLDATLNECVMDVAAARATGGAGRGGIGTSGSKQRRSIHVAGEEFEEADESYGTASSTGMAPEGGGGGGSGAQVQALEARIAAGVKLMEGKLRTEAEALRAEVVPMQKAVSKLKDKSVVTDEVIIKLARRIDQIFKKVQDMLEADAAETMTTYSVIGPQQLIVQSRPASGVGMGRPKPLSQQQRGAVARNDSDISNYQDGVETPPDEPGSPR